MITVLTESSAYRLDRSGMTATRLCGQGAGQDPAEALPFETRRLRRDGEPVPLIEWPVVEVGRPMELWLRLREDGNPTRRVTTNVREVREVRE